MNGFPTTSGIIPNFRLDILRVNPVSDYFLSFCFVGFRSMYFIHIDYRKVEYSLKYDSAFLLPLNPTYRNYGYYPEF